MHIKKMALYNFRNFKQVDELLLAGGNLLIAAAPNATGKTNFIEAVVMLLRGRSFRAAYGDCVRWGEDEFGVRGQVERGEQEATVAVRYNRTTRKMYVEEDRTPVSPVLFYQHYPLTLFLPEDAFLFTRGPAQRRNFLNRALVSVPAYVSALVQYQRALKQRNANLKTAESFGDVVAWTEVLAEHAQVLWTHRQNIVAYLTTHLPQLYSSLTGEELPVMVKLEATNNTAVELVIVLERAFRHERRYGHTLYGPHRDDVVVSVNNRSVSAALSRGQQRSLIIAMKLAAHRYISKAINETPLFVADELLSELDEQRQETLLANLPTGTQVMLTATEVPASVRKRSDTYFLDLRSILDQAEDPSMPRGAEKVTVLEPEAEVVDAIVGLERVGVR